MQKSSGRFKSTEPHVDPCHVFDHNSVLLLGRGYDAFLEAGTMAHDDLGRHSMLVVNYVLRVNKPKDYCIGFHSGLVRGIVTVDLVSNRRVNSWGSGKRRLDGETLLSATRIYI